jgi:hypothetical protein
MSEKPFRNKGNVRSYLPTDYSDNENESANDTSTYKTDNDEE